MRHRWSGRRRPNLADLAIFSLPVLGLFVYLVATTISSYRATRQYDDWWSQRARLEDHLTARLRQAVALPRAVTLRNQIDFSDQLPGILRLRVDQNAWDQSLEDASGGWGTWVEGLLLDDPTDLRVRVRKRGDTSVHWTTPKKSFTLRARKSGLIKGFRELGVSGKEALSSYVANRLAGEFDLLSPYTALSPVYLNDRFYGVFRLVETVDESFLRRQGRMPGNIFRADAAERGEYYKNVPRNVFENPYIWDRVAVNDVPGIPADSALFEFLATVNGSGFQDHLRLMKLVDPEEIARLIGALLIVGDPYHMSGVHNQFWYEDPATGRLHPIPWDLRVLELRHPAARVNNFFAAVLRDPFLVDRILAGLAGRLADERILRAAARLLEAAESRYSPYLEYDRLRSGLVSDIGSAEGILGVLSGNAELLSEWIADSRLRVHAAVSAGELILDVESLGYAGSELKSLRVEDAGGDIRGGRWYRDANGSGTLDAEDPEIPGAWTADDAALHFRLDAPLPLLSGWDAQEPGIAPAATHYRLFLRTEDGIGAPKVVVPDIVNRFTGEPAEILDWLSGEPSRTGHSWHPWRYPEPPAGSTTTLAGQILLTSNLVVAEQDTLRISAGATLLLDPDVSIIARGVIIASGSEDRPIRLAPSEARRPWGAVILSGPGGDESRFEHVHFEGGGGARVGRVAYRGMVSVHGARGVVFERCRFADNLRSDDALNAVGAEVTIRESEFLRANGDAVDYDHSGGVIVANRFLSSRNDAIDLMGSSPRILDNDIRGSGDKGISIGEESHPLVFNNRIEASVRGVEVKDRSRPLLLNNVIADNQVGVLQQVKNWRYGAGGWMTWIGSVAEANQVDHESDDRSAVTRLAEPGITASDPLVADWVYAASGVQPGQILEGRLADWREQSPVPPIAEMSFEDTFETWPREWSRSGGVHRIRARESTLMAWVEKRTGAIRRSVAWDLSAREQRYAAVVELSGRRLESIELRFESTDGAVAVGVEVPDDPTEFQLFTIPLPPAEYTALEIELVPAADARSVDPRTGLVEVRSGRLDVRSVRVFGLPASGSSSLIRAPGGEDS